MRIRHALRRSVRSALFSLSGAALVLSAAARADGWDRDNGPHFASVQGVTIGSAAACGDRVDDHAGERRALYAATDSGVWRRCDANGRWNTLGAVIWASAVAADPTDDRHLFATGNSLALGTGLLHSRDAGASWTKPRSGLPHAWYNTVKVLPAHPSVALVGGVGGVYRSVDGGARWKPVSGIDPSSYIESLAVDPALPKVAFASGVGGVYRSADAGASWTRLAGGLPGFPYSSSVAIQATRHGVTVYAVVDGAVWRSADRGDTWARTDGFGLPDGSMSAVTIDASPRSPAVLYGLFSDWTTGLPAVYRSGDGGGTWLPAGPPVAPNDAFRAIATDPNDPGAVYTATQISGVQASRDGGSTWSTGNPGLTGEVGRVAVAPSAPQRVYASSYNSGPFRSDDGGRSWTRINNNLYFDALAIQALTVSPANPATVYIGTGLGVFSTTDAGANWWWTNDGMPAWNTPVQALAIWPGRPGTVWAGTVGSGVFRSVDGGPWAATGLTHGNVYAIAIDPLRPDTVYASLYEGAEGPPNTRVGLGIFKSTDGGAHWITVNNGLANLIVRTLAIDPSNPTTVYAGTQGSGIYKSVDAGQTWAPAGAGAGLQPSAIVIDPRDSSVLYASTYDAGVFRSGDGGGHWTPLNRGLDLPTTSAQGLAIDPLSGRRLYLATLMSGVAVLRVGSD